MQLLGSFSKTCDVPSSSLLANVSASRVSAMFTPTAKLRDRLSRLSPPVSAFMLMIYAATDCEGTASKRRA